MEHRRILTLSKSRLFILSLFFFLVFWLGIAIYGIYGPPKAPQSTIVIAVIAAIVEAAVFTLLKIAALKISYQVARAKRYTTAFNIIAALFILTIVVYNITILSAIVSIIAIVVVVIVAKLISRSNCNKYIALTIKAGALFFTVGIFLWIEVSTIISGLFESTWIGIVGYYMILIGGWITIAGRAWGWHHNHATIPAIHSVLGTKWVLLVIWEFGTGIFALGFYYGVIAGGFTTITSALSYIFVAEISALVTRRVDKIKLRDSKALLAKMLTDYGVVAILPAAAFAVLYWIAFGHTTNSINPILSRLAIVIYLSIFVGGVLLAGYANARGYGAIADKIMRAQAKRKGRTVAPKVQVAYRRKLK